MDENPDLETAADLLLSSIRHSLEAIRSSPSYTDPQNRVAAHEFLVNILIARLEEDIVFEADYPYFRRIDPRTREGGDNPDQRYFIAKVNGGEEYRIWGNRGSATRVDVQLYAGDPYIPGRGGRSAGFINFEDIEFTESGDFEILLSPTRSGANWLENPHDATRVLVRQIYADWSDSTAGELHIDRVGHEGDRRSPATSQQMADRFATAADNLLTHARLWPSMVNDHYMATKAFNTVSTPIDPGPRGGVPGRWMANCVFDLRDDEVLLITTWPMDTEYQSLQLANLWFSSFEYANAQTSLTSQQSEANADGSYTYVVGARDPGVNNWLDTMGYSRGVVMFRFDGMNSLEFDAEQRPEARVVNLTDLDRLLDPSLRRITTDERRVAIAARRRHVQRRFGF